MKYEPIKKALGGFFSGPLFMRRTLYMLLDILLLRTWHVKKALRKISRIIPYNAIVLDAGSGFGQYTWRMSRMNPGWKIDAIDIDEGHVNDCREFFRRSGLSQRVGFYKGDLTNLNTLETYDFILSVDVMEHIKEDETVFRNFSKALRSDGILLISTPSDKGGSDVHGEGERSFIDEHVRNGYSIRDITEKLSSAGFSDISAKYTYGKAGSISWRLSMKYPVKLLNISYLFFILMPFYYIVVFPFMLVLNFLDINLNHESGTGLLVTAVRKKR